MKHGYEVVIKVELMNSSQLCMIKMLKFHLLLFVFQTLGVDKKFKKIRDNSEKLYQLNIQVNMIF